MAKKRNYNRGQLGKHHPIQQTKFDTTNHVGRNYVKGQPLPQGYGPRDMKTRVNLNHHEKEILGGIANSLQCSEPEALRIMLHEFSRRITDGTITNLYHSKKVSASQQANDWLMEARATEKTKGMSMEAVKAASQAALTEAEDRAARDYEERGDYMDMLNAQGLMHIYMDETGEVDAAAIDYTRAREADAQDAEVYGEEGEQTMEQFIAQRKSWGATPLEAQQDWEEELKNREFKENYDPENDPFWDSLQASLTPCETQQEEDIDYWVSPNHIS